VDAFVEGLRRVGMPPGEEAPATTV